MRLTTMYNRQRFLLPMALALLVFGVATASAQTPEQTLTPQDDSFTHSGAQNANFSSRPFLRVANISSGERTSFVDFNWSLITSTVTSATLRLYVDDVRQPGSLLVSTVLENWFELGLRYNNQPAIGPAERAIDINSADEGTFVEIDVTAVVQGFQAGMPPPNGFALSSGGVDVSIASAESANPPELFLTTDGGPINTLPAVTITAPANGSTFIDGDSILFTGTATDAEEGSLTGSLVWTSSQDGLLGSAGSLSTMLSVGLHRITASVTDGGGLTSSDAVTVRVDPAGGGSTEVRRIQDDSFTHEGAPNANFSSRRSMRVADISSGERISFLRPNLVGLTGNVTSATLRLFVDDVRRDGTMEVSTVIGNWFELGLRWNNQPIINPPNLAVGFSSAIEGRYLEIDVTSIVQGWQARNPPPFGIALRSAGDLDVEFATTESVNPPELVVTTSAGTGNTAPTVMITAPADGSSFTQGDSILFSGAATDAEEGSLSSSLTWTSNLDGLLGSGASFSTMLSVGTHTIMASVSDSGGLAGTSTIVVTVNPGGGGTTGIWRIQDDSFTHEGAPNANFSSRRSMRVANIASGERISFLEPNLVGLTGAVTSATLRLFVDNVRDDGAVQVSTVIGNWFELGIRWNNQPIINPPVTSFAITGASEGGYIEIDVTSIVQGWQARNPPPFGIALRSDGDVDVSFATTESDNVPELVITTTAP